METEIVTVAPLVSEAVFQSLIAAFVTIALAWMQYLSVQTKKIHALVNSNLEESLTASAHALRRLAAAPDHTPEDVAAAEKAAKRLADHIAQTKKADDIVV